MEILKYTPLFPIYYVFHPREVKDIFKSILSVIIEFAFIIVLLNSNLGITEERIFVENKSYHFDESSPLNKDFNEAYNLKKNENKKLEISQEETDQFELMKLGQLPQKEVKNALFKDMKSVIRKYTQNSEASFFNYLYDLEIITGNDTNNVPEYIMNYKQYGQNINDQLITYERIKWDDKLLNDSIVKANKTYYINKIKPAVKERLEVEDRPQSEADTITNLIASYAYYHENDIEDFDIDRIVAEYFEFDLDKDNPNIPYEIADEQINDILTKAVYAKRLEKWFEGVEDIQPYNPYTITYSNKGISGLRYYWQDRPEITDKRERKQLVGSLGEVGWKGNFPVFIQGDPVDKLSKTPWKYGTGTTTLGESGCSLYSMLTILTAAGYDKFPIPNTGEELGLLTLANRFPVGPVLGGSLNSLGYEVKFKNTATAEGIHSIFNDLVAGIPYVINTKSGTFNAYTENGIQPTWFTTLGHFLVLSRGEWIDGKRMVEVVQSSWSDAGLGRLDQNAAMYDIDELFQKGILKSSGGISVPAYTVVGGKGLPKPTYLMEDSDTTEYEATRTKQILALTEQNKWINEFYKQYKIDAGKITTQEGSPIKEDGVFIDNTTLVNIIDDNLFIITDYQMGIMITKMADLPKMVGTRKPNSYLGLTSSKSRVYSVVQDEDGTWYTVLDTEINNKEIKDEGR